MTHSKIYILILFLLFVLLISSCDIDVDPFEGGDYGDTVIRGKVVDKADSIPLDSVLFTLSYSKLMGSYSYKDLEPKTDSTGVSYYEIYCMKDYTYDVSLSRNGYIFNNYPMSLIGQCCNGIRCQTNSFFL